MTLVDYCLSQVFATSRFLGGGGGGIRRTIFGKLVKSNFCPILLKFTLKTVETVDKDFSPGGLNIARSHTEVI